MKLSLKVGLLQLNYKYGSLKPELHYPPEFFLNWFVPLYVCVYFT